MFVPEGVVLNQQAQRDLPWVVLVELGEAVTPVQPDRLSAGPVPESSTGFGVGLKDDVPAPWTVQVNVILDLC